VLTQEGVYCSFPSAESSPDIGIIVHDRAGKVVMIGNHELVIETSKIGSYENHIVPLQPSTMSLI